MAFKTITNLKDAVSGIISGLDIDTVDNLYGAFERAARVLTQKAFIPEGTNRQNISLYDGVTDYPCDSRIFGTEVIDIRPQTASRWPTDYAYKRPGEQFDRTKGLLRNGTMFTFEHIDGNPIIRIQSSYPQTKNLLSNFSSLWTATAGVTNLALDTNYYYLSPSSLRFDTSGTAVLNTTIQSFDATNYFNSGSIFLAMESDSPVTSLSINIGSDAGNYYTYTGSLPFVGVTQNSQFTVYKLDKASVTGSPVATATDYVQITVNSPAQTNMRLGYLWFSLPFPAQIVYQTAALFKHGTDPMSSTIISDTDVIILNDSAYGLYEYESALTVLQQVGGGSADVTMKYLETKLNDPKTGLYQAYRGDNPSEEIRMVGSYYDNNSRG